LADRHIDLFYPRPDDRERSTRVHLEETLEILPWVATIDAFQHWIYTHPRHSHGERTKAWLDLRRRFDDGTDWSEHRRYQEVLWHRQLHLFGNPFYYIEYGIAQLGALMVWHRSLKDPSAALSAYRKALRLGGSVGLKQLFIAAGGRLDFSSRSLKPLVESVMDKLRL
jgi:oligoendopeptidase F